MCFKGHKQENEKITHRMGGKSYKLYIFKILAFWICKELLQFNNREIKYLVKIWAKDLNRHLSKKTDKWPLSTRRGAQHHLSLEKYEQKPKWDAASHSLGWLYEKKNEQ